MIHCTFPLTLQTDIGMVGVAMSWGENHINTRFSLFEKRDGVYYTSWLSEWQAHPYSDASSLLQAVARSLQMAKKRWPGLKILKMEFEFEEDEDVDGD